VDFSLLSLVQPPVSIIQTTHQFPCHERNVSLGSILDPGFAVWVRRPEVEKSMADSTSTDQKRSWSYFMEVHRDCSHNRALFATLSRQTSTTKHNQAQAHNHNPQATSHKPQATGRHTLWTSSQFAARQVPRLHKASSPAVPNAAARRTPFHLIYRSIDSSLQSTRTNDPNPTPGPKQHRAAVRVLCSSRPESAGSGDRAFAVSLTKAPSSASQSSRSLARCTPPGTERHCSSSSNPYVYLSIYRDLSIASLP